MKEKTDYAGNEGESYETQRLLDHDSLAQNYEEVSQEVTIVQRFTTRATLQICKCNLVIAVQCKCFFYLWFQLPRL